MDPRKRTVLGDFSPAYRRLHTFVKSRLPSDIAEELDVGEKGSLVCVAGYSQQGKTLFLLALIGLRDECVEEVETVLRAGRNEGDSSTSTAIYYGRSHDERYHVHHEGKGIYSGFEPQATLRRIRDDVERREQSITALQVLIPRGHFRDDSGLTVLDLPGVNSSTRNEGPHVDMLFKAYVPLASLVLWVSRANAVQSLETMPRQIQDRWKDGAGVALVATHFFSLDSNRRLASEGVDLAKKSRELLRSQLPEAHRASEAPLFALELRPNQEWLGLGGYDRVVRSNVAQLAEIVDLVRYSHSWRTRLEVLHLKAARASNILKDRLSKLEMERNAFAKEASRLQSRIERLKEGLSAPLTPDPELRRCIDARFTGSTLKWLPSHSQDSTYEMISKGFDDLDKDVESMSTTIEDRLCHYYSQSSARFLTRTDIASTIRPLQEALRVCLTEMTGGLLKECPTGFWPWSKHADNEEWNRASRLIERCQKGAREILQQFLIDAHERVRSSSKGKVALARAKANEDDIESGVRALEKSVTELKVPLNELGERIAALRESESAVRRLAPDLEKKQREIRENLSRRVASRTRGREGADLVWLVAQLQIDRNLSRKRS